MGSREIASAILASNPCRNMLTGIAKSDLGKRVLNRVGAPRGIFANFDQAWAAARQFEPAAHNHPEAIKTHLVLSTRLRASDYAVLFWLSELRLAQLRVFDFGGNVGNLYYSYGSYLEKDERRLTWTVFDLPTVMDEGRKLAKERGVRELRFASSVEEGSGSDVLLASGALHYWEKDLRSFLQQFAAVPKHIFVNRTPVHAQRDAFITVQTTDSYAVPCLVRNESAMIAEFAAEGYKLADRWPVLELALRMPLFPDYALPNYSGFYFRRSD